MVADADHPIGCEEHEDGPRPYVRVRDGLDALIARPVYYELVQRALDEESQPVGLWSAGRFFSFEPAA